jgi:hypothetical protein
VFLWLAVDWDWSVLVLGGLAWILLLRYLRVANGVRSTLQWSAQVDCRIRPAILKDKRWRRGLVMLSAVAVA